MNKFFFNLYIAVLILGTLLTLFAGFTLPADPIYLVLVIIVFAVVIIMHENLLTFLTIELVFPTRLIAVTILVALFLYIIEIFIPGVGIGETVLKSSEIGLVSIETTSLGKYATIALISMTTGLLVSTLHSLNKK